MNKEEIEAAQRLVNTPITAENVDEPIIAVFPAKQSEEISRSEYIDGKAGVAEPAAQPTACALEMCFFLAAQGSKYCKHHRDACERYDARREQL